MPPRTSDKPKSPDLNLDSLESEGEFEPFVFVLDGHRYEMLDVSEMDWQEAMDIEDAANRNDVRTILKALLSADDWERFSATKLSIRKFTRLSEEMYTHMQSQLGTQGEERASAGS